MADGARWVARGGWARDEVAYPDGRELGEPVDYVTCARQPVTQRPRYESRATGATEGFDGRLARDEVARRVLVRAHGEGWCKPAQERRVPERLSRLEDVDHLLFVHELHRAVPDHIEHLSGCAVLDENDLALGEPSQLERLGDPVQLARFEAVEWWMEREERDGVAVSPTGFGHSR